VLAGLDIAALTSEADAAGADVTREGLPGLAGRLARGVERRDGHREHEVGAREHPPLAEPEPVGDLGDHVAGLGRLGGLAAQRVQVVAGVQQQVGLDAGHQSGLLVDVRLGVGVQHDVIAAEGDDAAEQGLCLAPDVQADEGALHEVRTGGRHICAGHRPDRPRG
jgi:hypothetical protein